MAELNFYDSVDYREIDFDFRTGALFVTDVNWTIHDVDYPTVCYFIYKGANDVDTSFDLYGTGFEYSGESLVAGTVQAIYHWFEDAVAQEWYYNFEARGLSVSAVELQAVGDTADTADDQALLQKMLAQGDRISLSDGGDYMSGFGGKDRMHGKGGNDTLFGGTGNDKVYGDAGADEIWGGAGQDRLEGGAGRDSLSGGSDADVFVFTGKFGVDVVADFEDGIDHLDFGGASVTVSQHGADTWLQVGADKVILLDVDAALISTADYVLA